MFRINNMGVSVTSVVIPDAYYNDFLNNFINDRLLLMWHYMLLKLNMPSRKYTLVKLCLAVYLYCISEHV